MAKHVNVPPDAKLPSSFGGKGAVYGTLDAAVTMSGLRLDPSPKVTLYGRVCVVVVVGFYVLR